VLIVLLGLSETWLRHRFGKIERITGVTEWSRATFGDLTYFWDTYHPRYGWTNLPGYRSDDRVPFRVTINDQGLRADHEYARDPGPGTYRIAVLGDSCTFGEDVDDDQTLPYYIEKNLKGVEVMNFGVHGFGLGEMVLRMENEVFDYKPDLVLLVITSPSDFGRTILTDFVHPKPAFVIESGRLEMLNSPVPTLSSQPFAFRHSFLLAWLFGRPLKPEQQDERVPEVSRALLERAKTECERRGVPLGIVTIAGPDWIAQMARDTSSASITEATRAVTDVGVPVSDQIAFLVETAASQEGVVADTGGHWSGRGNCLLAGSVAADLVEERPELTLSETPPGCPATSPPGSAASKQGP
jgi:hypothetical protein